ncbi:MAG TPA: SDR family oxidoreductase [Steroidobacteraceae bacterium]|nr:SDR family oxidoreductase [Steroidobacteraceae bacterium]
MHNSLEQDFDLSGRVAVVTGAASGIGLATASVLAQAGARVVIADINPEGLSACAERIRDDAGQAVVRRCDVSQRADVDSLAQAAMDAFGRLDVWVNSAGVLISRAILDVEEQDLDRLIGINLKGTYWGCAAAARAMRSAGTGSIINLSSGGAESAVPGLSIYSLTKAAMNMLTRSAAKEFGPFGIRVNAIAPGWVDTPMGNHSFRGATGSIDAGKQAEGLAARRQASPLGLTGTPRDVALAALYLACDAARFVTGQIIRPNGGVAMP